MPESCDDSGRLLGGDDVHERAERIEQGRMLRRDYPSASPYPPKPKNWAKGLGNGSGECGKCGAWWTGANTCHCTACCNTFSSQTACDKHRAGSHAHGTRHCLDPATVVHGPRSHHAGESMLVDAGRDYPCWGFAGSDVKWWGGDAA